MATITGVAGTSINATCTVSNNGAQIEVVESSATAQSICNDLATIKSGNCTISGNKTFSGVTTLSGGVTGTTVFSGGILKAAEFQFGSAVSVTRTGFSQPVNQGSGAWAVGSGGKWRDSSTGSFLRIPVDVPTGALLKKIRVWIDPAGGHGGVPTVAIVLTRRVLSTGVDSSPTQSGGTETSGSVGAYEAVHSLELTLGTAGAGITVNRATSFYEVVLEGEGGGNALANLDYLGIEYDYEVVEVGVD